MEILLLFAFLAGFVTILAPCIWPLLPIVLSTSVGGGRAKSLGITLGIVLSFGAYNLSISYLVRLFGFNPEILRWLAIVILVALGLMMVVPFLSRIFEGFVSRLAGGLGGGNAKRSGFGGGFVTGLSLGVVWTPCAGPILTAIATLSATAKVSFDIILVTIAYLIGVSIPLFLFSYGGQKFVSETKFLSPYTGRIQQIFGAVLLLTALAIATNYDKVLQAKILDALPSYSNFLTSFEKNDTVKAELKKLKDNKQSGIDLNQLNLAGGAEEQALFNAQNTPMAPEFVGISKWLNLPTRQQALTMQELRGKVVLIDFWTYTCINCIRTLPFVMSWYDKYKDQGFVVVGVHTPEFEFEKSTANVEDAIKRFKIHYPVAQDNDYKTWDAYSNQYWPAEYLIDAKGIIRRVHFGEGEYDKMEKAIQLLLKEAGQQQVAEDMVDMPDETPKTRNTPETYLGSKRMEFFYPSSRLGNGTDTYTITDSPQQNTFSLGGTWTIADQYSMAGSKAVLVEHFDAQKAFLVMRPGANNAKAQVRVSLDGELISSKQAGIDVVNGIVTIDSDRLYELVDLKGEAENHILKLEFLTPGTEVYAFTFG